MLRTISVAVAMMATATVARAAEPATPSADYGKTVAIVGATVIDGTGAEPVAEDIADAYIARQAGREDRLKNADYVIDNSGSVDDLARQIGGLWDWLRSLPQLPSDFRLARPA